VSKANPSLSDEDLAQLFSLCSKNNNELQITGILLHSMGNFFQVLEGEEKSLKALFEKIKNDARHTDVFMIYYRSTTHPAFLNYDSKFNVLKSRNDLQRIKYYLDNNLNYSTNDKLSRLINPFLMFEDV
jgi:hypothetical protein